MGRSLSFNHLCFDHLVFSFFMYSLLRIDWIKRKKSFEFWACCALAQGWVRPLTMHNVSFSENLAMQNKNSFTFMKSLTEANQTRNF